MSLSEKDFAQAKCHIPGGVNSPVRAFKGVSGTPIFMKKATGPYMIDVDDQRYIDYVGSWGPMIVGHNHPQVLDALQQTLSLGISYGAPTENETRLAEKICTLMPAIEQIRLVNSGTEATMSAIRVARGFTGRSKILKFQGCYHGHSDALLVKAGSGALTLGVPDSAGVPAAVAQDTLIAAFNDLAQVSEIFNQHGEDIAAIIVEPIAGNMNMVMPAAGFLAGLRKLCDDFGSVLIFDEVMTGFRVALGGASAHFGIQPDMTTLGKVIGGGLPVGAFGGRADIMAQVAPVGPVYQAGTLSGNPLAVSAGLATLSLLEAPHFFEQLHQASHTLTQGLAALARDYGVALHTCHLGGLFGFSFTKNPLRHYHAAIKMDQIVFKRFHQLALQAGIYFAPSAFEAGFISITHDDKVIQQTLEKLDAVFKTL